MPHLIWNAAVLTRLGTPPPLSGGEKPNCSLSGRAAIHEAMQIMTGRPGIGRPVEQMDLEFRDRLIGFDDSRYIVLHRLGSGPIELALAA